VTQIGERRSWLLICVHQRSFAADKQFAVIRGCNQPDSRMRSTDQQPKQYDRAYYQRWYRDPEDRVSTRESLERKVRMAVGVAEYLLGRRIRTVLDIGCGEAPWFPLLKRMRRDVRYTGVESSEYALERYGVERHIRRGDIASLSRLELRRPIDLVICADVLQYVSDADLSRGLAAIRRLLGGVAYLEAFATEDEMEGDRAGWQERSAARYRRMFRQARLTPCGPYCYVDLTRHPELNVFEHL
jgi:SAM-dependent methyltransferase